VEDEESLRALEKRFLSREGYNVLEASSGPAALELLETTNPESIALLVTDLVMPGNLSGIQLAELLKNRFPALKVIYTSGYSPDFRKDENVLIDGVNFLQKPFKFQTLLDLVSQRLAGS
jgi:DNA-binding NtrC family response regulator